MNETGQIYSKLAAIMRDVKAIGKDRRNQQQGFNFRGIDTVMNHLHPIFAEHGVCVLPTILDDKTEERTTKSGGNLIYRMLRIQFSFIAQDGSSVQSSVMGEGMDSGDKASNKAMAVALKYALTQMLLLPYDEVDPDATSPEPSVKKPVAMPTEKPAAPKPAAPPAQAKPAPAAEAEPVYAQLVLTMIAEKLQEKPTKDKKSVYWELRATINGKQERLSTKNPHHRDAMESLAGQQVEIVYVANKIGDRTYLNIVSVEPVIIRDTGAAAQPEQPEKEEVLPF